MSKTYSAGIVTAYGAAKRAGYQGTYEDFCRQQAQYAESAATVEQAKNTAVSAASTATAKAGEAATAATAAQTAKTQTEQAASQALTDIGTARTAAISAVQTKGQIQTENATAQAQAAATSATTASTKASEASASATSAGQSATNAAASATSAANAASAAQGVLVAIPSDYSQMSADVTQLKADLETIIAYNYTVEKNFSVSGSNVSIIDDANACISDYIPLTWVSGNLTWMYTDDEIDSNSYYIVFYDANKEYLANRVRSNAPNSNRVFTSPVVANIAYARISFKKGFNGRLNLGTSRLYRADIVDSEISTLKSDMLSSVSKARLISCLRNMAWSVSYGNVFIRYFCDSIDVNGWVDVKANTTIGSNGAVNSYNNASRQVTDYIDVHGFSAFTSFFDDDLGAIINYSVYCYGQDKSFVGNATTPASSTGVNSGDVKRIFPSDTYYVRLLLTNASIEDLRGVYTGRMLKINLTDANDVLTKRAYALVEVEDFDL